MSLYTLSNKHINSQEGDIFCMKPSWEIRQSV